MAVKELKEFIFNTINEDKKLSSSIIEVSKEHGIELPEDLIEEYKNKRIKSLEDAKADYYSKIEKIDDDIKLVKDDNFKGGKKGKK